MKPVHRRILFGMSRLGVDWNKKYMKCARVVGEVMGSFTRNGNLAIYDAACAPGAGFLHAVCRWWTGRGISAAWTATPRRRAL